MIKSLKLVNFRNFSEKYIDNFELKNFIVWENWRWKTNILEALSILCDNSILKLWLDDLVKIWEEYFFIEIFDERKGKIGFYYSKVDKKKNFLINNKKVTKKIFLENISKVVILIMKICLKIIKKFWSLEICFWKLFMIEKLKRKI